MIVSRSRTIHPQSTALTLDGTVLKESAELVTLGLVRLSHQRLILGLPLRSTLALFSELQIMAWYHEKVLASISWSVTLSDILLELCPAGLGVLLSCVVLTAAYSHSKLLDSVVRSACILAGGVFRVQPCQLTICSSVVHVILPLKVTQCILWAVHYLCRMCRRGLLVVFWLLIGTCLRFLAIKLLSTAEPLCPTECHSGMILVTLCLMVWLE